MAVKDIGLTTVREIDLGHYRDRYGVSLTFTVFISYIMMNGITPEHYSKKIQNDYI